MSHFVYIIGRVGSNVPSKIGISADPVKRLSQLQTGSAEKLELRGQLECPDARHAAYKEAWLHNLFAGSRLSGEWFGIPADNIASVWGDAPEPPASARMRPKPQSVGAPWPSSKHDAFHPMIPVDLMNVPISEMSYPDRIRFWSACDLPPPPEGFDDWYLVGNEKMGVLAAFPIVGFISQEPKG